MIADFLYLASSSPRRRELLTQIGVPFRLLDVAVDEAVVPGEAPEGYVLRLAQAKAACGVSAMPASQPAPVLAADTAVVMDGRILLKPADARHGERLLRELSGRAHEVLTAVALATSGDMRTRLSRSEVTFRVITPAEARAYGDTGECLDKAGGYAIQGRAAVFVANLRGSYSGVMGLPLCETAELLAAEGLPRWLRERDGH